MRALVLTLGAGSRAASMVLGALAVAAAALALFGAVDLPQAASWTFDVLGAGFVVLLALLVFATAFCAVRVHDCEDDRDVCDHWFAAGTQSANGVATLALTYTLFGISLGIGSLAGQGLTPETVESVIRNLTASFSLAFMTTVIGLPLSALLRAALVVVHGRRCLAIRDAGSSLERRKP